MNILLWVLQAALAVLCVSGGIYKITHFEDLQAMVASMRALPRGLWLSLGVVEALGGLGVLLPSLSPFAAVVVAIESVAVSATYAFHGDFSPMGFTVVMAALALFIAYGRFVLKPHGKPHS
jgi:putative oxidoreductase